MRNSKHFACAVFLVLFLFNAVAAFAGPKPPPTPWPSPSPTPTPTPLSSPTPLPPPSPTPTPTPPPSQLTPYSDEQYLWLSTYGYPLVDISYFYGWEPDWTTPFTPATPYVSVGESSDLSWVLYFTKNGIYPTTSTSAFQSAVSQLEMLGYSDPAWPARAPGAPTGINTSAGNGTLTVTWTAPSSTGGSPVTGYNVYLNGTLNQTVSGTTATISGLSNGTSYTVTVSAVNGVGESSSSSGGVDTPFTVPGPPGGVNIN